MRPFYNTPSDYLITGDKWGCLPIFYACLGGSPLDILNLLVDSHTSFLPDHIVDVKKLVEDLSRYGAPLDTIKLLLGIEHKVFPVQKVDWEQFISDMAASDTIQRVRIDIFHI